MRKATALILSVSWACLASGPAGAAGADGPQGREAPSAAQGPVTSTSTLRFERPRHAAPGPFWQPVWGLPFWPAPPPVVDEAKPEVTAAANPAAAAPPPASTPAEPSSIRPLLRSVPASAPGAAGWLRLEVTPAVAQIFVDGFYAGTVEEARESRSGLRFPGGWHRVELRAPGHETLAVNVTIEPGRISSVQRDLRQASR